MVVNVAGAGAGKTTKMADIIMGHDIPDGKVAFVSLSPMQPPIT